MALIMFLTVSIITILSRTSPITSSDVSSVCSINPTTVSAVPGQISYLTSPNYPSFYDNHADCWWLINAGSGYVVKVTVLNVSLETCCDVVSLYDGSSAELWNSIILIDDFSSMPSQSVFHSNGQYMYIRFYSDFSITSTGFRLTYEAVEKQSICSDNTTTLSAVVGEVNYLESPYYPYNYPNYVDCRWLIDAGSGYVVKVTVLNVSLQACCDVVYLYDATSADLRERIILIDDFSSTPSQSVFHSNGQYMYIRFTSDTSVTYPGFRLTYEAVEQQSTCSENTTALTAVVGEVNYLESSYYPYNYPNSADCRWLIDAGSGYVVKVTVLNVSLETCCDVVSLHDGRGTELWDTSIIIRVSSMPAHPVFHSSGQYMYIRFYSDGIDAYSGFTLTYEAVEQQSTCSVNPSALSAVVGEVNYLESPYYPNNYPNHAECWWLIDAGSGYVVKVTVLNVSLQTSQDALELYDTTGARFGDASIIIRFSSIASQLVFHTSRQYMYIRFYSDSSITSTGFRLTYEAVEKQSTCSVSTTALSAVVGEVNYLESPYYPYNYPNNAECRWRIDAGSGYVVKVTVLNVSLDRGFDFLELSNDTSLSIYITSMRPRTVFYSSGQYMYIRFSSSNSITSSGFRLTYEAVSDPQITSTSELTPATTTSASATGQQRVINVKVVYRKKCTRN